jgi:hypothetical protein
MADTVNPRLYQDAEWLRDQVVIQGKNSRDISREQKVSYHLVELYLEKFGIPFRSTKPVTNNG